MTQHSHTGRNFVLVGGAGIVAWWLLSHGNGWGFRGPGDSGTGTPQRPERCVVWIRADRIEVDGVVADLPTVIVTCRAANTAEVHATGDAITGTVVNVIKALRAVGVKLELTPDLAYLVPVSP